MRWKAARDYLGVGDACPAVDSTRFLCLPRVVPQRGVGSQTLGRIGSGRDAGRRLQCERGAAALREASSKTVCKALVDEANISVAKRPCHSPDDGVTFGLLAIQELYGVSSSIPPHPKTLKQPASDQGRQTDLSQNQY
jgi:hypothetical protein